jgi:hypothetical protein
VAAWFRLALVTVRLRWVGFQATVRRIPGPIVRDVSVDDIAQARGYAAAIGVAARVQPLRALCLAQSIALHAWLRQTGIPSELRIGVGKAGTDLKAHAWVELGGTLVNSRPADLAPFTPLVSVGAHPQHPARADAPLLTHGIDRAARHVGGRQLAGVS